MNATVAVNTVPALYRVMPALLLGAYLVFGAACCYRRGEVGFRSPGIARREDSPVRFLFGVILLGLGGLAFIALGLYSFIQRVL
jgi:hypothetical protein